MLNNMAANELDSLPAEEIKQLGEALKDDKFREMLLEYAEELSDPENRKKYEEELAILEKESGFDMVFIYPEGGYVMKTFIENLGAEASHQKVFINMCKNKHVGKPSCSRATNELKGLNWNIPFFMSPPHNELDKTGKQCIVYDAVFHSDTLYMAQKNSRFRKMVEDTAIEGIQEKFNINLERNNIHYPKMKFKGQPIPTILRKKINKDDLEETSEQSNGFLGVKESLHTLEYNAHTTKVLDPKPVESHQTKDAEEEPQSIIPKYTIRYRSVMGLEDYSFINQSNPNTRPKELVVAIDLPLLNSTQNVKIDVDHQRLILTSNKDVFYNLNIGLPYPVDDANGTAKFDQNKQQLTVTLPIFPFIEHKIVTDIEKMISPEQILDTESFEKENMESTLEFESKLDLNKPHECHSGINFKNDVAYVLPSFICNQTSQMLAVIIASGKVDDSSVTIHICDCKSSLLVIFFNDVWNSLCIKPCFETAVFEEPILNITEAKLILQIVKNDSQYISNLQYSLGKNNCNWLIYDFINKENVLRKMNELKEETEYFVKNSTPLENDRVKVRDVSEDSVTVDIDFHRENIEFKEEVLKPKLQLKPLDLMKFRTSSESSEDMSPRGILKYPRAWRNFSESSDEFVLSPLGSFSPDTDFGLDDKPKKSVRFNDCVLRNIFRPNSSILGQKKKNQKRTQHKKKMAARKGDRRSSESETSETFESGDAFSSDGESIENSESIDAYLDERMHKSECLNDDIIFEDIKTEPIPEIFELDLGESNIKLDNAIEKGQPNRPVIDKKGEKIVLNLENNIGSKPLKFDERTKNAVIMNDVKSENSFSFFRTKMPEMEDPLLDFRTFEVHNNASQNGNIYKPKRNKPKSKKRGNPVILEKLNLNEDDANLTSSGSESHGDTHDLVHFTNNIMFQLD